MRVTFLDHSGFLVELPSVTLLFDWWKGELPVLRGDIPLLVFASHAHEDHFDPKIFALHADAFLLGKDIKLTPRRKERWGVSEDTAAKCLTLKGGQTVVPLPGITVETLPSTDEGVAFLVTADGQTVFHAGDLNWWHWTGEDPGWNGTMAANFKKYTAPLAGRRLDLAMLPLDPRLGEDGFRGPRTFLELADIRHFVPMHQWGDLGFTDKFLEKHPQWADRTTAVTHAGETFTF